MHTETITEIKKISNDFGGTLLEDLDLSLKSAIGTGGKVRLWYEPLSEEELSSCIDVLVENGSGYRIAGNGSNVLYPDSGFDGIILSLSGIDIAGPIFDNNVLTAPAGMKLSRLLKKCIEEGFSGLEGLAGIPATIGGAIKNNASGRDVCISDKLSRILVLGENGEKRWLEKKSLKTGYRRSDWPGGGIILRAEFILKKTDPSCVREEIKKTFLRKMAVHPCEQKSLGCVFKNPSKDLSAWRLIRSAGMCGERSGGAVVSEKHANFIVNDNKASSADIKDLIKKVKSTVERSSGIMLEEEIEILPER